MSIHINAYCLKQMEVKDQLLLRAKNLKMDKCERGKN